MSKFRASSFSRATFAGCGMAALAVWLLPLVSSAVLSGGSTAWMSRVDPWVLDSSRASSDGRTDFIIFLDQQADLSGAAALPTKAEKGRYVYEQLTMTARFAQQGFLTYLEQKGVAYESFWIANMIRVHGDVALVQELTSLPSVRRICANPKVHMFDRVASVMRATHTQSIEWNVSKIRASDVWGLGYTGQGIVVAGQDTGYDWQHPALLGHYRGWDGTNANHNYNWHDAIHSGTGPCGSNAPAPCDDYGHGTHTMGTMVGDDGAGNQIGMAPGAKWIGARNMDQGNGTPTTYAECFQWFIAPTDLNGQNPDPSKAPDVINDSWLCPPSEGCTSPDVLHAIVAATKAAGIVVVASAGNDGSGCSTIFDPPAIYDVSFTVGATDAGDAIAGFSSRGPVTVDGSGRLKPDVCAPGVDVRSSYPGAGYGLGSGTSMAGPHVAGMVALLLSAHPGLRGQVDAVERLIRRTALPLTTTETCGGIPSGQVPNNTYGWGRIDAYAAVGAQDSDGDGMPDWWENLFGLNPTNAADAGIDADGDGFNNAQEYLANTSPTNRDSVLRVTDVSVTTSGVASVQWSSRQDGYDTPRLYDVLRSSGPLTTASVWSAIATNLNAPGDVSLVTDDLSTNAGSVWFYRIGINGHSATVNVTGDCGVRRRIIPGIGTRYDITCPPYDLSGTLIFMK